MSLASVVCCQVEVSVTNRSLVQRRPTACGVPECDREASTMSRPWRTRGRGAIAPWKKSMIREYVDFCKGSSV